MVGVALELAQHGSSVPLVDNQKAVEEFAADGAALIRERAGLDRFITEPAWGATRQRFNSPIPMEDNRY